MFADDITACSWERLDRDVGETKGTRHHYCDVDAFSELESRVVRHVTCVDCLIIKDWALMNRLESKEKL